MISFRKNQFQAIFTSLVMVDAVCQGRLPWGSHPANFSDCLHLKAAADLADNRWCQAIAAQLSPLDSTNQLADLPSQPAGLSSGQSIESIADLLIHLPQLLSRLDWPSDPLWGQAGPSQFETIPAEITALQNCLQACLSQDYAALTACHKQLAHSLKLEQTLVNMALFQAIELVLAASGDLQLAVGQSLRWSGAISGLPLLTGILSAGWGGLSSLPSPGRLWLEQPPDDLQNWLCQRWHLPQTTTVSAWAVTLWQHWSGQSPTGHPLPIAAVTPLTMPPKNYRR
ncbi:MAG: hypothetical protein ACFB0E_12480 [Leptolyngbyaceae cyanobacterium]